MSKRTIANNFLNYTKSTAKLEREIKLVNCKNETRTYFLVINPKTKKIEEDGWIGKKSIKRNSKSKSNSGKKSVSKRGGRKHKKTVKRRGKKGKRTIKKKKRARRKRTRKN
jgi:hypothetical protein|tara:strand:- start:316 stop:648 length:333 start_codon:yes stop_codon:yes gene_type:complete